MTDPRSFLAQDRLRLASSKKIARSGLMKSRIAKWLWISLGFLALTFGTHANAASIAALALTTDVMLTELKDGDDVEAVAGAVV